MSIFIHLLFYFTFTQILTSLLFFCDLIMPILTMDKTQKRHNQFFLTIISVIAMRYKNTCVIIDIIMDEGYNNGCVD